MDLKTAHARAAVGRYGLELAEVVCIGCCLLGLGLLFGAAVVLVVGGLAGVACFERATTLRDRAAQREAALRGIPTLSERAS